MSRRFIALLAGWLGLSGLAFAQGPERVVSLLPSTSELVCRLGACNRLVGIDRHSNHPDAVNALPRVGSLGAWSLETLVRLRPDVVFIPRDPQLALRLKSLGLTHRVVDPQTLPDVQQSFIEVAESLGLGAGAGQALWQELQHEIQLTRQALPSSVRGQRLYLEVDSSGVVAGPTSYLSQLIESMGLSNAMDQFQTAYPQVSPESVLRAQPDWVILLTEATHPVTQRPGWSQLKAVQQGRVCTFRAPELNVIVRPGPRLDQAVRLLADCVQGRRRG